jgi:hypothetical protein
MQFRERMQTEAYRLLYRKRSEVAEFPNAWLKGEIGIASLPITRHGKSEYREPMGRVHLQSTASHPTGPAAAAGCSNGMSIRLKASTAQDHFVAVNDFDLMARKKSV